MFGLGKPLSKFGKFLRKNDITQTELKEWSGVNQNTISRISRSNQFKPSLGNGQKIIRALKRKGFGVDFEDFWM
ncbi:helix-turn-helix domain-containing protein [Bacillus mobilis]|uniref:XRE family transcriptional regulator n=2 Tax=Bacillus cereus group TaxID=86661 RepID=A0A1A9PYJ0_9BACI|nr:MULTISPECIES: helix-turn-helix transcriptional regulator [Bacillus]MCH4568738.1 helix-turn-helix domain-containing protein [Bacillus sp. ES1-5]OUB85165.1 transcriptional regulator [Bacillus thuringiensis serovar sinensis]KAA0784760.1 XRE family transcriptional regulator [Bacillus sp. BPN334]MCG3425480.1 helix-turn-helix domain-containing protein [Bacillus thuringiensis]MCU5110757.1 helix-turn-helix domain-containing protein [Bacillus wiedmannii]